jgi:enoyl-CoA hydratase/carnithine racemase
LPRVIGRPRALEMLLTKRWLNAEEAYQAGLVNRITSRDTLLGIVEHMARDIASLDPLAVRCAKEAVVRGAELTLAEGLIVEKKLAAKLALGMSARLG